ncbi:MAG: FG-GAP-like repeat-containing protein [Bacteroidetes bacterium]|nr:FG-GAP-like repeat-containing protein [Bacteroidota bacterium]
MNFKFFSAILLVSGLFVGCGGSNDPQQGSELYNSTVSAFYDGVTAMEVGEDLRAQAKLNLVTELAPNEPASWANLALMSMRRNELPKAQEQLTVALDLDSTQSDILVLAAAHARMIGDEASQIRFLRKAVSTDSLNSRAIFELLEYLPYDSQESESLMANLMIIAPGNTAVILKKLEQSAITGSVDQQIIDELDRYMWGADVNDQIAKLRNVSQSDQATIQLTVLRNILLSESRYRQDLADVRVSVERIGDPIIELLRLETPSSYPSPKDDSLQFIKETQSATLSSSSQEWISAVALGNNALPAIFFAGSDSIKTFRGEAWPSPNMRGHNAATAIDYNSDFRMDLMLVGTEGLRMLRQDSLEQFSDVTDELGLSSTLSNASYSGVWTADIDLEGDLDLVLNHAEQGLMLLRNNGDGTFGSANWFSIQSSILEFSWADLDQDGDPDAALLDNDGHLIIMDNQRQGQFTPISSYADGLKLQDVTISDTNSDGKIELLLLTDTGEIHRMTLGNNPLTELLAQVTISSSHSQLLVGDLDNNGGKDLVVTSEDRTLILLQDEDYQFYRLEEIIEMETFALSATRFAGRLDLIGIDSNQQPARYGILPSQDYHWKQIQPRAAQAVGDQRINSFGIGGEVEIRAGLLYQKQPITQPIIHFGLGSNTLANVARITWPNGSVQAEFDLLSDEIVSATQRLKGSCPWLFTWNGEEMTFVTDFIWRSPLGLRINAQETAGIMTTEDWVKISGDQLQPQNGYYDVRITAELWETHFFDHVSLKVVDHPIGTEIFVDERFAFPPPELKIHVTSELQPIVGAWDDGGHDLLETVTRQDNVYADFFGRGDYQGITRSHYLEIEIDNETPQDAWLVAKGWIRPTDSSINVAISQGDHSPPIGLRLEAQKSDGTWETIHENLGFPSGKTKTILIDLSSVERRSDSQRFRLHTNLEIYWDALFTAAKLDDSLAKVTHLMPTTADLRYRGFSIVNEKDRSSPELPVYSDLSGTAQIWRDLQGYHTRFGDVIPLLETIDDRYVIMNAGDEMLFQFPETDPVVSGNQRDFVLIGDGWVKDGDYNTTFSKTLRPLPSHGDPTYDEVPGRLQDDPVYQRHASDWIHYHTRYVSPDHHVRGIGLSEDRP